MMNRGVMQRQMFSNGGEAEAQQRNLIINQIFSIAERTNRPLDPAMETFLQSLSTSDLINYRDVVVRQNPYSPISQEPRERFEVEEYRSDPNMTEQMVSENLMPPPSMNRMEMLKNNQAVSSGRPTPDVFSGRVGDVMGEQYRGRETYLVPGEQMPKRPKYERDEYIIQGNIPNTSFEQGMESDLKYLQKMRRNNAPEYKGMAAGGEAVPNRLKGFSKLPESVQMQMNPSLAKKYQQGGIASMMDPASMPQGDPMMGGMPQGGQMDPEQMAMMEAEAEAAGQAQGEQIGAMVGEQTMAGLDQAEDFQGAIDALRGNSAPLEARYQELAGFVGDQDAMQTPESVLAMVQPTIMMTEEGAVDSGIGQLMEQITGNIAMETPDGQPTAMAEGVGSLMGVGQQPAEKKFLADGGAVIGMSGGGNPFYEQALAEQQAIYGNPQASKDAMQANILFNIADRGLLFAGGVDPNTGQSMAGAPLLSQIGRAASGLGATIGEQVAQQTAQERAMRAGALQRAQTLSDKKEDRDFALSNQFVDPSKILIGTVDGDVVHRGVLTRGEYTKLKEKHPTIEFSEPVTTTGSKSFKLAEITYYDKDKNFMYSEVVDVRKIPVLQQNAKNNSGVVSSEVRYLSTAEKADYKTFYSIQNGIPSVIQLNQTAPNYIAQSKKIKEEGGYIPDAQAYNALIERQNKDPEQKTFYSLTQKEDDGTPSKITVNFPSTTSTNDALIERINKEEYLASDNPQVQSMLSLIAKKSELKLEAEFDPKLVTYYNRDGTGQRRITEADFVKLPVEEQNSLTVNSTAYTNSLNPDYMTIYSTTGNASLTFKKNDAADRKKMDALLDGGGYSQDSTAYRINLESQITDKDFFRKFGMTQADFEDLDQDVKDQMTGVSIERDIKLVDGVLVDLTKYNNTGIKTDIVEVFGASSTERPKPMNYTINGVTQPFDANNKAEFDAVMKEITEANKAVAGSAGLNTVGTFPDPQFFLVDGELVTSFDRGKTYTDSEGNLQRTSEKTVYPVGDVNGYQVYRRRKDQELATEAYLKLDAEIIAKQRGLQSTYDLDGDGKVSEEEKAQFVKDQKQLEEGLKTARLGTGSWARIISVIDAASGILPDKITPQFIRDFGLKTQEAKQSLRLITALGRPALIVNNKYPVMEMKNVERLFSDPDSFFTDSQSETQKLILLAEATSLQLLHNLKNLAKNKQLSESDRDDLRSNNVQIRRLLTLLPGIPSNKLRSTVDLTEAQSIVDGSTQ